MAAGLHLFCLLATVSLVLGDVYMHNPRGSNNRLNERSANRDNANRMFDSQNNNRGGYNAGDVDTDAFQREDQIYYMKYFQSGLNAGEDTVLQIEWTNQHGCGGNENNDPHKLNCNVVLQYMVQDYDGNQEVNNTNDDREFTRLRDGSNRNTQTHNTPNDNEAYANYLTRRENSVRHDRGLHEVMDHYDDCTKRQRNRNLFTADQVLRGSTAKYTRQNPNGNRRGYECPEERDYYPYWHPTPWRDIAVLTDNISRCQSYYQQESFNVQPRQHCREMYPTGERKMWSEYNNNASCVENGGTWFTEYAHVDINTAATNEETCTAGDALVARGYSSVWAPASWADPINRCLILPPAPECEQVGWSRVNHLGNGRDGVPLNYTWTLPSFLNDQHKLVVVRIRYNISTDDYHPWLTNSSFNANLAVGQRSPVEQNPNVNIGSSTNKPLRLAINTAQFGRTFQDRSHVIQLRPRSLIPAEDDRSCRIHNLNVRGKRGNIVQVYPSVEYDFIPNRLALDNEECIHIQWTGSNTHNNGAPGGDGQTGDAGEGTGGTDRHNMMETPHPNSNYPLPVDTTTSSSASFPMGAGMFKNSDVIWASFPTQTPVNKTDLEVAFASAGYYHCIDPVPGMCTDNSVETKTQLNQLLNNAPASFEGALLRFSRSGVYYYICSRNNNFTNRSQKGMLTVKE